METVVYTGQVGAILVRADTLLLVHLTSNPVLHIPDEVLEESFLEFFSAIV